MNIAAFSESWGTRVVGKSCRRCGKFYADAAEGFHRLHGGFVARCKTCIRETAKTPTIGRSCRECGKAFSVNSYLLKWGQKTGRTTGMFCSRECFSINRKDPARRCTLICARCSKPFESWANRVIPRKYCSHGCAGVAHALTTLNCLHCDKSFDVLPSVAKRGRRFCSTQCVSESRKTQRDESRRGRFRKGVWKPIRAAVLERDGNACVKCGATERSLHAHHKVPWQDSHDDSMDNLVTLCNSCHMTTEAEINPRHKYHKARESVA